MKLSQKYFSDRTPGFWIGLAASVIMLVSNIAFLIYDRADITFSYIVFGVILAGSLLHLLVDFTEANIAPLLVSVCFGVGTAYHFYQGLPTLSDVWNGVNFIGGNPKAVIIFGALFLVGMVLSMVSCFMNQRKNNLV